VQPRNHIQKHSKCSMAPPCHPLPGKPSCQMCPLPIAAVIAGSSLSCLAGYR
jgi:hypothetical protein